jgi:hypothetical protein
MAVIHIPEEEAVKDFDSVLTKHHAGDGIVIDGPASSAKLVANGRPKVRTVADILEIYDNLPGERGVMDEDFARDVLEFRKRHPESLDSSKWD